MVNVNNIADRYKTKNTPVMDLRKGFNLRVFNSVTTRGNRGGVEYHKHKHVRAQKLNGGLN